MNLSDVHDIAPTFKAPIVDGRQVLTFELVVADYLGVTRTDVVDVIVDTATDTIEDFFGNVTKLGEANSEGATEIFPTTAGNYTYVAWTVSSPQQNKLIFSASSGVGSGFETPMTIRETAKPIVFDKILAVQEHVYMIWLEQDMGAASSTMFFVASHDHGAHFEAPQVITNDSFLNWNSMAASEANDVYIAWVEDYNEFSGNGKVVLRASNDNGTTFGSNDDISSPDEGGMESPWLAASGDAVFVAWSKNGVTSIGPVGEEENPDAGFSLMAMSGDSGHAFNPPANLSDNSLVKGLSISSDGEANLLLRRMESGSIGQGGSAGMENMYFLKTLDSGNKLGELMALTNNTAGSQKSYYDAGLLTPDSNIFIKWDEVSSGFGAHELFVLSSQDSGRTFTTTPVANFLDVPVEISDSSGTYFISDSASSHKMAASGDYVSLVYQAPVNDGNDIHSFYAHSFDAGKTFEKRIAVPKAGEKSFELLPRMALTDDGRVHIVWLGGQKEDDGSINNASAAILHSESAIASVPEFGTLTLMVLLVVMASVIALGNLFRRYY